MVAHVFKAVAIHLGVYIFTIIFEFIIIPGFVENASKQKLDLHGGEIFTATIIKHLNK